MFKRAILITSLVAIMPVSAYADDHRDRDNHDREYRDRAEYTHCRHSSGTTGLVAGGVGGAVLGGGLIGGGIAGPLIGGVAGALGGRAIDRSMTAKKRCR